MAIQEFEIYISEKLIDDYACVSKDVNPIHMDKISARKLGFPNRIAHGMIFMSIAHKFITPLIGKGWFVSMQEMKFTSPIFLYDTVVLEMHSVKNTTEIQDFRIIGCNGSGMKVLRGKLVLERLNLS